MNTVPQPANPKAGPQPGSQLLHACAGILSLGPILIDLGTRILQHTLRLPHVVIWV